MFAKWVRCIWALQADPSFHFSCWLFLLLSICHVYFSPRILRFWNFAQTISAHVDGGTSDPHWCEQKDSTVILFVCFCKKPVKREISCLHRIVFSILKENCGWVVDRHWKKICVINNSKLNTISSFQNTSYCYNYKWACQIKSHPNASPNQEQARIEQELQSQAEQHSTLCAHMCSCLYILLTVQQ